MCTYLSRFLSACAVLLFIIYAPHQAQSASTTNLIANPTFGSGISPWKIDYGASYVMADPAQTDVNLLRVAGATWASVYTDISHTVTPGASYVFTAEGRVSSSKSGDYIRITSYNAKWLSLSTQTVNVGSTNFALYSLSFTVPATAKIVYISLVKNSANKNDYVDFKNVNLTLTSTPAACGSHTSGTTYALTTGTTGGTTTPTVAQCPYGGTQPTTLTTTQSYKCTNGVQTTVGSSVVTTTDIGIPVCNTVVNGACGAASGTSVSNIPTTNLCFAGTATVVTGTGPWSWSCLGAYSGNMAPCTATLMPEQMAARASDFVNSIGVNTHLDWGTSAWYGKTQTVLNEFALLGIKNAREVPPYNWMLPEYEALATAGVKFNLVESTPTINAAGDLQLADALQAAVPGSIISIEGANEYNGNYDMLNGQSSYNNVPWGVLDDQDLRAAVNADPNLSGKVSVIAASMWSPPGASYNVAPYVDASNWHVYSGVGQQITGNMRYCIGQAQIEAPLKPVYITETGISTSGYGSSNWGVTDEPTQAIIITNAVLDGFYMGASKTFIYELMDNQFASDQEDNFGIFHADGTPKPAATAISNMTKILADSGTLATPGKLGMLLTGLPNTAYSMVLEKSNGNFYVVIWNANATLYDGTQSVSPASSALTLSLGSTYSTINIYDPVQSKTALYSALNATSAEVSLGSDPLILELIH